MDLSNSLKISNFVLTISFLVYGCSPNHHDEKDKNQTPSSPPPNTQQSVVTTDFPVKPAIECPKETTWSGYVAIGSDDHYYPFFSYQKCIDTEGVPNGPYISFFKNGSIKRTEGFLKDDKFVNFIKYYNPDGSIKFTSEAGDFCPPNTTWIFTEESDDDRIDYYSEKCEDTSGKLNGPFLSYYYDNHQKIKKEEGFYKNDTKNGDYRFFDKSGSLINTQKWVDGLIDLKSQGAKLSLKIKNFKPLLNNEYIEIEYEISMNGMNIKYDNLIGNLDFKFINKSKSKDHGKFTLVYKLNSDNETLNEGETTVSILNDNFNLNEIEIQIVISHATIKLNNSKYFEQPILGLEVENTSGVPLKFSVSSVADSK